MHVQTTLFVVGVALGVAVGFRSSFASEVILVGGVFAVVQGVVYLFQRKRETSSLSLSLFLSVFTLGIVLGALRVQFVKEPTPFVCEPACTFSGVVISSPEMKDTYQRVVVRPDTDDARVYDVLLRAPLYPVYEIGESVSVTGKVVVPETIYPHGDEKGFDYLSYLHTNNIGSESFFPKVEVTDSTPDTLSLSLGRWKEELVGRIESYIPPPASSLASGMLFGNSSMSSETTEMFRVAGLSHIVVLSGFNIAIVIASILFVFAFLPFTLRIVLASLFVIIFVVMVGAEASVVRATAMAFIALLASCVGRPYVARQALLISFLGIILYDPSSLLYNVSLHLSFLATAGIIYLSPLCKQFVQGYISRSSLIELCTTTLAAYVVTLPYVMHTFGTVSVYALVANVLALPLVPVTMLLSFSVVLMSYVSVTMSLVLGYVTTFFANTILFIARVIEQLPFASFSFMISFWMMLFAYVTLVGVAALRSEKEEYETDVTKQDDLRSGIISY